MSPSSEVEPMAVSELPSNHIINQSTDHVTEDTQHNVKVEEQSSSLDESTALQATDLSTTHSTTQSTNQPIKQEPSSAPASRRSNSRKSGGTSRARAKSTSRYKLSVPKRNRGKKNGQSSSTRSQQAALEQALAYDSEEEDADAEEDDVERPPQLSVREMEQEKQALAYRLLLKRPEFIARRRAQQAEARSHIDTLVARWPYIDSRNVDTWKSEQAVRKHLAASSSVNDVETRSHPMEDDIHSASQMVIDSTSSPHSVVSKTAEPHSDEPMQDSHITNPQPNGLAVTTDCAPVHETPDDDLTESDEDTPKPSNRPQLPSATRPLTVNRIPRIGDDKRSKLRQSMLQQTSSQCPSFPESVFAANPVDPYGLACVNPSKFGAEFMIGSRCHFVDRPSGLHREGCIVGFSPTRGHQIRLQAIATESSRSKDALQRWIHIHEEPTFWEIIDVAWARNPDLKSKQKYWPCQVVHLYRFGVRVYSRDSTPNQPSQRTIPDYVLVHLLGYYDDFELHEIPTRLVFPFFHGLKENWDNKLSHKAAQLGLETARWLYHFHSSKWLRLENERRRAASDELCKLFISEGPSPFIGKRVSCLWKEDAMWYAGVVTQFNSLTQSFCVLYDDRELEWIAPSRNVFTFDSFALPVSVELDEDQPYPNVDLCYYDFRLYADNPPATSDTAAWLHRMDAVRKYQSELVCVRASLSSLPDPPLGQQGEDCWECGLVDDVFLLSAMRGVDKKARSDNITCQRCNKMCHPRCYALMRDRLEHGGKHNDSAHVDDLGPETDLANHRRGDADEGGQRWTVVIDKSKPPRCVDCLKCEHCNLFGAKSTKPRIVEEVGKPEVANSPDADASPSSPAASPQLKEEYVILRAPGDLLTCDVCNIRVHRQCLEPPFGDSTSKLVGGWVCRACLACRLCHTTQAQFEQDMVSPQTVASSSINLLSSHSHLSPEVDSSEEMNKRPEKPKIKKKKGGNRRGKKIEVSDDPLQNIIQALETSGGNMDDADSAEPPVSSGASPSGDSPSGDRSCSSTPPAGEIPADIVRQLVRDVLSNIIFNITDTVAKDQAKEAMKAVETEIHSVPFAAAESHQTANQVESMDVPSSSLNSLAVSPDPVLQSFANIEEALVPLPSKPVLQPGVDGIFWQLWKYEFSMCNSCSERMAAREYCVVCCGLWDDLGMVQCDRCVRWVHIECDPMARNTNSEKLNEDHVKYYCPDCCKREKANGMIAILDALNNSDRNHYFLNPVTAEDAPEYFDTIKTPMDFTTIYNKLYSMSYIAQDQFKYDLNLVWRNAKDYNPVGSPVYKTALRLQQKSVELLDILRIQTGDNEMEQEEGRIEDKRADQQSSSPNASRSSAASKEELPVRLPTTPPPAEINHDQREREHLLVVAIQPFRFFYPPDTIGDLMLHIDVCSVCGASGDHEHFLACSDCGDMFHWFCVDIDMLRRAYRDPVQTGGAHVAAADYDSLNNERLTGQWKCHNCAVCSVCSAATRWRTLETKQVQRRVERDREREEFGEEQTASYTVQIASENVVQQPIIDCDLCDRTFHISCLGPSFVLPPSLGSDFPPPPFRCDQCVYCLFCGANRPGKKSSDQWQLGYTACNSCAKLWRDGKYCSVCQQLWRKSTSNSTSSGHSSVKSEHSQHTLANGHDHTHHPISDDPRSDSMQCEMCRKWAHLACDPAITQLEYELLGDSDFDYYCPTCRHASSELRHYFDEQQQDLREQIQRKSSRAAANQDFTDLLMFPLEKGVRAIPCLTPGLAGRSSGPEYIASRICSTIFMETVEDTLLSQLQHHSQRSIMEATKHFVRQAQTLRRRQRRKWLIQQKRSVRADLPLEARCAPWVDENVAADHNSLLLIDKMLKQLLIIYKRKPDQSSRILPRILTTFESDQSLSNSSDHTASHTETQVKQSGDILSSKPITSDTSMTDDLPPALELVTAAVKSEPSSGRANGHMIDELHNQDLADDDKNSSDASHSIRREPGMLIPVARRHHSCLPPLPIPAFTFEGQHITDPRVCFLCNKHGDQEEHLDSSGRLLPADPFRPALSYVHVHCALWASAMYGTTSEQGAMTGVFTAYSKSCRQQCSHCGELTASIGCRFTKCKKFYHFDCAIATDCIFTADTKVYCAEHASRTKNLVEHHLVPIQRAMFVKITSYDVTDGKIKLKPNPEIRAGTLVDPRLKTKSHHKRKKPKESPWHEKKKPVKKQKLESLTPAEHAGATSASVELEEGEIDPRLSTLEDGEIEGDEDDDGSKSEQTDSVVKNEADVMKSEFDSSSPSLEQSANQTTVPTTLFHQRIGALTIISLGSVNPRPGFHTSHFIYPVGFHACRLFWSYIKKHCRVGYHLHITAHNDDVLFRIIAEDDPQHPIETSDPGTAFSELLKRLRHTMGPSYHITSPMLSASWMFGYGLPPVVEQLEYHEASAMLSSPDYEFGYNSRRMEVRKSDLADLETERLMKLADERAIQAAMNVEVSRNPTGCARLEPYAGKRPWSSKVSYMVGFGFNTALSSNHGPGAVSFSSSNLAATVELASDKRRKVGQVEGTVSANAMSAAALTHAYRAMKTSVMPRAVVGHSVIHEWGLFAAAPLDPNTMVVEYLGESIRQKVADMREKRYEETGIGSCYMFRIDSDQIIDATKRGNIGRFINHSCDPNCVTRIIDVNGVKKIAVITNRRVSLGEEITYDYFFANEADRIACNCGARNCAGRLN